MVKPINNKYLKIGKTVFNKSLDQEQYDKYLPPWLQKMVTTREVCRQQLGSDYDSHIVIFKEAIESVMKAESMGA